MNENHINDIRKPAEFRSVSFSGYKKSDVKKGLTKAIFNGNIETACYWGAELICAGHYLDMWEIILLYMSKHIHLGNPKLPIYIEMRMNDFKAIVDNGYAGNELAMRNSKQIRILFCEVISVLCKSEKKHSMESLSINMKDETEFLLTTVAGRLKAPSTHFCNFIIQNDDPKALFIVFNEFAYAVSMERRSAITACRWFEWIIGFETLCKMRKEPCFGATRGWSGVTEKYYKNIIWILWEIIKNESEKRGKICSKIIDALFTLFTIRYTPAVNKRRRFLIYFAISMLTDYSPACNSEIISSSTKEVISQLLPKIDVLYRQVKKNEHAPAIDYLFNGIKPRSSLEKTIEKLNKMNEIINQ
jgi:hypothetical protein